MIALPLTAATADIRGIRGPIALPGPSHLVIYLVATALVLLLAYAVVALLRRRRQRPLTPYARAKLQLEAAANDPEAQRPDVFAERVSGALREYVEARFELPATHRTTEEFMADLLVTDTVSPQLVLQRPQLTHFLATCDEAKFAGRGLHDEAMRALRTAALQFIDAAESAPAGVTA